MTHLIACTMDRKNPCPRALSESAIVTSKDLLCLQEIPKRYDHIFPRGLGPRHKNCLNDFIDRLIILKSEGLRAIVEIFRFLLCQILALRLDLGKGKLVE